MSNHDHILVVDDEAVIRELLCDILEDEGFKVTVASNGRTAIKLMEERDDFVLLFTDIMMPEMDGIQLLRAARRLRPSLIPIVMTGFATLETARDAVREGAYDYVLKPFSLSEIKLAVSNALERYQLTNENARLRELTELFYISESIAGIHQERTLLDFVLKAALERVDAERGSIMLTTPNGEALEVAASVGLPDEAAHEMVRLGTGISGWVAANAQPLLIKDVGETPDFAGLARHLPDSSFVSVPLRRKRPIDVGGGVTSQEPTTIAVLNVCSKRDGGQFTEGDLKTLDIVASHAAVALDNVRLIRDLEDTHLSTLQSMALLLEARDAYTHGHSQRVRQYCEQAARHLGMSDDKIAVLGVGAALHDIGKVGVSDAVLNKVEDLTEEELESIRRHPTVGFDILKRVRFLSKEHLDLVRSHHERMDGTGYPDGLTGDQLPLPVRIISVADAYDAMSSDRAYRRAMPPEKVIDELRRGAGTQFDAEVVGVFISLVESGDIK